MNYAVPDYQGRTSTMITKGFSYFSFEVILLIKNKNIEYFFVSLAKSSSPPLATQSQW